MDGMDGDLGGWDDVGAPKATFGSGANPAATTGQGSGNADPVTGLYSDAVTSAMLRHLGSELATSSLSMWPAFMLSARRYFNVTHGYVVRKVLWIFVPTPNPKHKSSDGEIGGEKCTSLRIYQGLEVDIEEPDLYIPTMGFITYVLLCGIIRGLESTFRPETLASIMSVTLVVLVLEVIVTKAALFMGGADAAPVLDLVGLVGYKYVNLSFLLIVGLLFGYGHKPQSSLYFLLTLALIGSCAAALFHSLRKLARMQARLEAQKDIHSIIIKVLPALQLVVWYFLLPTWPELSAADIAAAKAAEQAAVSAAAAAAVVHTTTIAAVKAMAAKTAVVTAAVLSNATNASN